MKKYILALAVSTSLLMVSCSEATPEVTEEVLETPEVIEEVVVEEVVVETPDSNVVVEEVPAH